MGQLQQDHKAMTLKRFLLLFVAGFLLALRQGGAQAWVVQHLESMDYPRLGILSRAQATLKVRCRLDGDGTVLHSEISERDGPPRPGSIIERAAVENARKWRFRYSGESTPPEGGTVTLVYSFRLSGTCEDRGCRSQFSFDLPDRVVVSAKFSPLNQR